MKKRLVNGISLAIMSLVLGGCGSNNSSLDEKAVFIGSYKIVPDGSCEISSKHKESRNMSLEISKNLATGIYEARLPAFENSLLPSYTGNLTKTQQGLSLLFEQDNKEEGKLVTVDVDIEVNKQFPEHKLVTKFYIKTKDQDESKNVDRDFVKWYLSRKAGKDKTQATGLCAVKVTTIKADS